MKASWGQIFFCIFRQELRVYWRQLGDIVLPIIFASMVVVLFALGIAPTPQLLTMIAPGVIWITVLLSILLSVDRLFRQDMQEGWLEQWLLSPWPLAWLLLPKILAHWILILFPLLAYAAIAAVWLNMSLAESKILFITLLLGTPTLLLLGAMARSLTLRARQGHVLIFLLILPCYVPILIFATSAVHMVGNSSILIADICWLAALLVLALPLAPCACAAGLRASLA